MAIASQSVATGALQSKPINYGIIPASAGPSASMTSSTPAMIQGQTSHPTSLGIPSTLTQGWFQGPKPVVQPTSSGGAVVHPSVASAYTAPAQTTSSGGSSVQNASSQGLAQYISNSNPTSGGGTLSTGASGNVTGYTAPVGYNIDTTGSVNSSSLGQGGGASGLAQSYGNYQDYVNAVSAAQGYSPAYINALQGQYGAQTQGAQLGLNSAMLNSNLYTGNNLPGDTMNYAQGATAKAQAQNTLGQAENSIQQLAANQALNTQQLARTGQISAAQTQLQYSPTGMSGSQAISQYQQLQQQYPGANIPPFNPQGDPVQQYNAARQAVASSPAYQAGFQSTFTTPGGGTGIYSKLNVASGGFQQNQDGSYTLVPAAAAALGSANANIVGTQLQNLSNINSAITASQKTLDTTTQFMNQYGLNQSGVSILSQIENSTNKQLDKAGAVAGLNADLNALRSDYAQYLIGRGGSVAGTNQEAQAAIPDTISPAQLQILVHQMQTDGKNAADAVSQQVNQALSGITNNNVGSQAQGGSSNVGSSWGNI